MVNKKEETIKHFKIKTNGETAKSPDYYKDFLELLRNNSDSSYRYCIYDLVSRRYNKIGHIVIDKIKYDDKIILNFLKWVQDKLDILIEEQILKNNIEMCNLQKQHQESISSLHYVSFKMKGLTSRYKLLTEINNDLSKKQTVSFGYQYDVKTLPDFNHLFTIESFNDFVKENQVVNA